MYRSFALQAKSPADQTLFEVETPRLSTRMTSRLSSRIKDMLEAQVDVESECEMLFKNSAETRHGQVFKSTFGQELSQHRTVNEV